MLLDYSLSIHSFQSFLEMENLTVVSTIFCPRIISIVSHRFYPFFSWKSNHSFDNVFIGMQSTHSYNISANGNSNRWFNDFLFFVLQPYLSIDFNLFFKRENLTVVSTIFCSWVIAKSIHSVNLFLKW